MVASWRSARTINIRLAERAAFGWIRLDLEAPRRLQSEGNIGAY